MNGGYFMERPEVQALKEAIDKAISKQLSEKHAKPSYYVNRENAIKISVIVDAVPLFREEKETLCNYLQSKWLAENKNMIIGDYFVISKILFQKKYKVTSRKTITIECDEIC